VRLLDLNPFEPVGINAQAMRFIDVFLLHCLLSDSPDDTPQEIAELASNQHLTAARGREPGLNLLRNGRELQLTDWGEELLQAFVPIARSLDAAHGSSDYSAAVRAAQATLHDASALPSSRVLAAMAAGHDNSFVAFSREHSLQTRQALLELPWQPAQQARFEALARQSLADQKKIEAADTMPFEIFRQDYVSPKRLGLPTGPALQHVAPDQGDAQHQREPSHQG